MLTVPENLKTLQPTIGLTSNRVVNAFFALIDFYNLAYTTISKEGADALNVVDSIDELDADLARVLTFLRAAGVPANVSGVNLRASLNKTVAHLFLREGDAYPNFDTFVNEALTILSEKDLTYTTYPIYVDVDRKIFSLKAKEGFIPKVFGSDHDRVKHVGFLVVNQGYKVI